MQDRDNGIVQQLLTWYPTVMRDLPFRRTRDPYRIWVSEIMAQQTRITALLPYYERFIERFPNVQALAEAPQQDVLKLWEGLGYYARARNMQAAAQQIVQNFGGQLPADRKALLSLPGIGEYTAGAILCNAFDIPCPAVDGNVMRAITRIERMHDDITLPATKQLVTQRVAELMPPDKAHPFTQSLIELGAMVCLPRNPKCSVCPVHAYCLALQHGEQSMLPIKSKAKAQRPVVRSIALLQDGQGRYLLRQREERLLHGMWEFPGWEGKSSRALQSGLQALGLTSITWRKVAQAEHVFSHIIWHMTAYRGHIDGTYEVSSPYRWVSPSKLLELPIPTAFLPFIPLVQA